MIGSGIVWRMALGHLRKQWKQTLLTVAAGAIGAMLIAISVVNYESVKRSGADWIETRLGPISWKLTPEAMDARPFSSEEAAALNEQIGLFGSEYTLLPYVGTEAVLIAEHMDSGEDRAIKSMLLLGFSMQDAERFDPEGAGLWRDGLGDDELIINKETASVLQVKIGDAVTVVADRETRLFRIRDIVEERGLTGYRESGAYNGTVIATEQTARALSGKTDGYESILAGATGKDISSLAFPLYSQASYKIEYLKANAENKIRSMNYTLIIGMISAVAVVSSMLFMRQVLVMIGESRQEMYGILRAIGMSRGHISSMFFAEAMLLSLFSALTGTIVGIACGGVLIEQFYGAYSEELARMSGENIPIHSNVSVVSMIAVFVIVLLILTIISWIAARKAGRIRILSALRGASDKETQSGKRNRSKLRITALTGIIVAVIHFYLAYVDPPALNGDNILIVTATWIGTCCFALLFAFFILSRFDRPFQGLLRLIGIPQLSVMLAFKYPRRHFGRTFTAGLLFALVMMVITFTVCLMQLMMAAGDVERTNQSVLGFGGYAAYYSVEEKAKVKAAAEADEFIVAKTQGVLAVEPYMLLMQEKGIAQAVLPVTADLVEDEILALSGRAPVFETDKEAWDAVKNNVDYVILPDAYRRGESPIAGGQPMKLVKAGDHIMLPVYEPKPRSNTEKWEPIAQRDFIVAGFVKNYAGGKISTYFYGTTYMNSSVVEQLRPLGHRWPDQTALGFLLYRFDYRDIKLAQELEERFTIQGIMDFTIPYLDSAAQQLFNKQIGFGFIGFTVISAFIGLLGLAVIQFRAVRERAKQVAMMRCIGLPNKQIYWVFFLEGLVISAIGLMTGLVIGSSGSNIFVEFLKKDVRPGEKEIAFHYPLEVLIPILAGLLLASIIINIAPARAALKLKAADALRRGDN